MDWNECIDRIPLKSDKYLLILFKDACGVPLSIESLLVAEVCNSIRHHRLIEANNILRLYKETTQDVLLFEDPEVNAVQFSETNRFSGYIEYLTHFIARTGKDPPAAAPDVKTEYSNFVHDCLFLRDATIFSGYVQLESTALYPMLLNCRDAYFQMYYEYIRINAVLDRRRDMLVFQTLHDGLYEAFYPPYSWSIKSEPIETVAIPMVPPRVIRCTLSNKDEREHMLIAEMDALTKAKRLVNRMIYKYQEPLTWQIGYPVDAINLKQLNVHSKSIGANAIAIELFSNKPLNDINHTVKNLDTEAFWDKKMDPPQKNLWLWRLSQTPKILDQMTTH
jgi:hypothetical protein